MPNIDAAPMLGIAALTPTYKSDVLRGDCRPYDDWVGWGACEPQHRRVPDGSSQSSNCDKSLLDGRTNHLRLTLLQEAANGGIAFEADGEIIGMIGVDERAGARQ